MASEKGYARSANGTRAGAALTSVNPSTFLNVAARIIQLRSAITNAVMTVTADNGARKTAAESARISVQKTTDPERNIFLDPLLRDEDVK